MCWPVRGTEDGYEDDPRVESPLLSEKTMSNGIVLSGKEKLLWRYINFLYLEWACKKAEEELILQGTVKIGQELMALNWKVI